MSLSVLLISFVSCDNTQEIKNIEEYLKWINLEENGLVKQKSVNGILMKVKLLTPDYLAYLENRGNTNGQKADSLISHYSGSYTFVLSIGPDEKSGNSGDIMYKGVQEYKEYAERMLTMNFDMEQYIKLTLDDMEYKPVLSSMENVYGLDSKRNLIFVFAPNNEKDKNFTNSSQLDFIYDGQMFDLGVNHFVFKKEDIVNAPKLSLQEINKAN